MIWQKTEVESDTFEEHRPNDAAKVQNDAAEECSDYKK